MLKNERTRNEYSITNNNKKPLENDNSNQMNINRGYTKDLKRLSIEIKQC
jgi:hypothetical protein